jgi:MFS family permease
MSTPGTSTRQQWLVLAAAFLGWMFDGLEQGLFPIAARPALIDLMQVTDDAVIGPTISNLVAAFLAGAALGGLLFGWMGDRFGRVRTMAVTILAYSVFTGLCYFIPIPLGHWFPAGWHMFGHDLNGLLNSGPVQLGALRFLAALGMGGEWALGVALVMECWPEKWRPVLAGAIGSASNFGFLLMGLLAVFIKVDPNSWRWVMLAGSAPALLAFVVLLFLPESERWKESVRKGGRSPIREIFTTRLVWPTILATVFASVALIGTWAAVSQFLPTWSDQLAGPERPHAKAMVQTLVAIGAIVGCLIAPILGSKIGRRPAYFGLCLCSLAVCTYLFRFLHEYNELFLFMCFLAGLFTAAFYGWLPLYLPELFPTRVRATGQGLSYNFGRVFAIVGLLEMGRLLAFFGGSYPRACASITLIYIVGMVLIWVAPETKGRPLPD